MNTCWPIKTHTTVACGRTKRVLFTVTKRGLTNRVTEPHTHTHTTLLMPWCRIMCAEALMLLMDGVRLAEAPRCGAICQPTCCQQRQRYKYLTLGELCLYAPSKRAQGRDNGVREMVFPLQLAAC